MDRQIYINLCEDQNEIKTFNIYSKESDAQNFLLINIDCLEAVNAKSLYNLILYMRENIVKANESANKNDIVANIACDYATYYEVSSCPKELETYYKQKYEIKITRNGTIIPYFNGMEIKIVEAILILDPNLSCMCAKCQTEIIPNKTHLADNFIIVLFKLFSNLKAYYWSNPCYYHTHCKDPEFYTQPSGSAIRLLTKENTYSNVIQITKNQSCCDDLGSSGWFYL